MTESSRKFTAVLIGVGFTALSLAGLGYLAAMRKDLEATRAPQLQIRGAMPDSPLVLQFQSDGPLALQPTGWGHGDLHIHAWVDHVQHMPAAADITRADSGYLWVLPAVARGSHRVQLGWADQAHRPLSRGASDTVSIVLR